MSKRSQSKYAGLDKSVTLKIRHELLDFDYLDKLNDDEKLWLSNFMREWASADMTHSVSTSDKDRKAIYNANNARNRDIYSISKSKGLLITYIPDAEPNISKNNMDYLMAALIDKANGRRSLRR